MGYDFEIAFRSFLQKRARKRRITLAQFYIEEIYINFRKIPNKKEWFVFPFKLYLLFYLDFLDEVLVGISDSIS